MTRRPLVIVFARAPQLGRVKTRLARGIGESAALRVYRSMMTRTLRRLAADKRFDLRIAGTPAGTCRRRFGFVPRRVDLVDQAAGDLGRRMLAALRAAGPRPVAIVGCDIPALDAAAVVDALRALATGDVVLGPSRDGGYWLIGWRGTPPSLRLLDGVRWSTAHAFADTAARLGERRLRTGRLLEDLDDAADLDRLRPSLSALR